jgi:hypothetical protein
MTVRPYEEAQRGAEPKPAKKTTRTKKAVESDNMEVTSLSPSKEES